MHGVHVGIGLGCVVDPIKCVVHNGARATISLGDHTDGAKAKGGMVLNEIKWEDHPETFGHHVGHVRAEELSMLVGGLVGAAAEGRREFHWRPRSIGKGDRDAVGAVVVKGSGGSMVEDTIKWAPV